MDNDKASAAIRGLFSYDRMQKSSLKRAEDYYPFGLSGWLDFLEESPLYEAYTFDMDSAEFVRPLMSEYHLIRPGDVD